MPVCLRKAKCKYDQRQTGDKEMFSIQNNTKTLNTASTILHHKQQLRCEVSYKLWTNHENAEDHRISNSELSLTSPFSHVCVVYNILFVVFLKSTAVAHITGRRRPEKRRWWRVVNLMLWTVFHISLMLPVSIAWTCSSSLIGDDR